MANKKSNKVKFGLKNCHYAKATFDEDGSVTYAKPVRIPGAVSLSMDANGEIEPFYADNIAYYVVNNNSGYEGDLEIALIPESFLTDIMHEELDGNNAAIQQKSIAQQNADKQKIENEAAIAKAEADKQVAITNAEAEARKTSIAADAQAEANRKLAESLSENLIEYQKIQKWDGKLPTVSGSGALVSIDPAE